ncbi:hypothetical protein DL96DRAFT_1002218 [Flagelloscypha sp. PMI_526]|nr:hypothetical protein DL96DRAFT_1002218 [Flagelloscypha sp. PMI_526]
MKLFILLGITMLVTVVAAPAPNLSSIDTSRREYEDIVQRDELRHANLSSVVSSRRSRVSIEIVGRCRLLRLARPLACYNSSSILHTNIHSFVCCVLFDVPWS